MSGLRYLPGVVSLTLDAEECTGCGVCVTVCPHGVFALEGGKALLADRDACIECGACARNCRFGAVSVRPGVGCAEAIIRGWITGGEPECGCAGEGESGSGCC